MDRSVLPAGEGRCRVAIEHLEPSVDDGRFAVKRILGETVTVTVDAFADGHDTVCAVLQVRAPGETTWTQTALQPLGNDLWQGTFECQKLGRYEFAVLAWTDAFETWQRDLTKRLAAGQDVRVDLLIGARLIAQAAHRASEVDGESLLVWQELLTNGPNAVETYQARGAQLLELMRRYPDLSLATRSEPVRGVQVEPERARYSTWYELFPRSCAEQPGQHGTFADCARWLPRLAAMGFDVVYLPPIHPIGVTFRKGRNNAVVAQSDDVGCPWAIGGSEGGHRELLPQLGTLDDFRQLLSAAQQHGIDIAMDIAFQCAPDHPYVKEHPQWFRARPDGTIQYAENPPKKYQDIYPFDFESSDWQGLWRELADVVLYWCQQGVRVFRVDNPHTKALAFWEYLIARVKANYPDAIFLSEAFTRPKIMYRLAKLGFSQSYTYFTWRNTKAEFIEYFTELTQSEVKDYFRPNLWPNTPDILPEHLQTGGRPTFVGRLVLAATLGASYGIYGPAYENLEHVPREPGSEEYLDSEKYQLRHWNFDHPDNLQGVITTVNRIRRENVALQSDATLRFHETDNDNLLCYSKTDPSGENPIVTVVNLNFRSAQHGHVILPLATWGIGEQAAYEVEDLLNGKRFTWNGPRNFVELDPTVAVAHIFRVRKLA